MKKMLFLASLCMLAAAHALADVTATAQALPMLGGVNVADLGSMALTVGGFGAGGYSLSGIIETLIGIVPAKLKPWVPVLLGVGVGMMEAKGNGRSVFAGIVPGLTMAGVAARHHDLNMPKAGAGV